MEFRTVEHWDETIWEQAEKVYYQAFKEQGRKSKAMIRRMLERRMCQLHIAVRQSDVIAMAVTGVAGEADLVLIDYLAVREDSRNQGVGRKFMDYIKKWAAADKHAVGLLIEIESDPTEINQRRYRFWEACGFQLTDYIHHYNWVPEPYQAMYCSLRPEVTLPDNGQTLFQYITQFHKKAYQGH